MRLLALQNVPELSRDALATASGIDGVLTADNGLNADADTFSAGWKPLRCCLQILLWQFLTARASVGRSVDHALRSDRDIFGRSDGRRIALTQKSLTQNPLSYYTVN